jgi:DNA-binding response OmpR family regulator
MTSEVEDLAGLRILVVEDTLLVADLMCDCLESFGCIVVGPAAGVQAALDLAAAESLDGALLDVNLAGELSFPVATALGAQNVPVVFLTGYDDAAMFPREFQSMPRIAKPFHYNNLAEVLSRQFGKTRRRPMP